MNCKLFGKTAVFLMMLAICLLFAPAASAAGTTGGSGSYTYYNDSFKLPADVTNIEEEAFCGCAGMKGIVIPGTVSSIGHSAFHGCSSLTDVYYHGTREQWNALSIGTDNSPLLTAEIHFVVAAGDLGNLNWVLDDAGKLTISGTGEMPALEYPELVDYIGQWRPYLDQIKTVEICSGVESIGDYAFCCCENLESVTIPSSVTMIGECAFDDCFNLQNITIPSSVTSIGIKAFDFCSSLKSVTIPSSVTSIGDFAFFACSSLEKVAIPSSVTSIGVAVFTSCSSLTSVTIPKSVTSIGARAFEFCSSLTSVTIPESVTNIGEDAFSDCYGLREITIPESVTNIGERAFLSCSSLREITIPPKVTSINNDLFENCTSLESVTIPSSVTSIGTAAFYYCSSLKSVTIPSSVIRIGEAAFAYIQNLSDIYYGGTQEQWQAIEIGENNDALSTAAIHTSIQTFESISITCNPANGRVTGTTAYNPSIPNQFTLMVTASEEDLTYTWQWREKGTSAWQAITSVPMFISTETDSNTIQFLTEDPTLNGHSYQFKCVVSKGGLSTDSNIIDIDVVDPSSTPAAPVITEHPKSITASGDTAVFKVTATGSSLNYQWQYRESASGSWKNASDSGNKTAQLTVSVTNSKNGYQYRCVVSNAGGTVDSNAATMTVPEPESTAPVVTSIESDYETVTGTYAYNPQIPNQFEITVIATGDNLTYVWQWREKGMSAWQDIDSVPMYISGGKHSNIITILTGGYTSLNGHSYQFKCVVSNDGGSTDSGVVTVNIVDIN